jgi:alpha,alpha-trehalose phosphorylase
MHIASLAGTWIALVAGFGGMRHDADALTFAPRLPAQLSRLVFAVQFQQRSVQVDITHQEAVYTLLEGTELKFHHHGTPLTATKDTPGRGQIPEASPGPEPSQPWGRSPARRSWVTDRGDAAVATPAAAGPGGGDT